MVDPVRWIYQFHGYGAAHAVDAVYENALTLGAPVATFTTWAALRDATLSAGQWAAAPAIGAFRLGAEPTGKITADVRGRSVGGVFHSTIGAIVRNLLGRAGLAAQFIDASIDTFTQPWNFYATDQVRIGDVCREAFYQAAGYMFSDENGVFKAGTYISTKTPQVLTTADLRTDPVVLDVTQDAAPPPVWRVKVGFDRCWSTHSANEISAAVSEIASDLTAVQNAAQAAQDTANAASASATLANNRLASMADDNTLDRADKFAIIREHSELLAEQSGIDARASAFGITTERTAYNNAITTLTNYLNGLSPAWNNTTVDTPIVSATFRTRFSDVYVARQSLLNRFAEIAAQRATVAGAEAGLINSNIGIVGGAISGIGTGNGTAVANNAITVDGSGILSGIGTANINVDNRGVVTTGTLAARPATGSFVGQTYLVTSGASLGLLSRWSGSAWVDGPTRNTGALADLNSVDLAGSNVTGTLPVLRADSGLRNNAITVDVSGIMSGIGTANINVDNRVTINTGTLAARPASGSFSGQAYLATDVGRLFRWSGSAWVNASDLTAQHTAAAIVGQSAWATSTIPTARLNNLNDSGVFNSLANITNRDLSLTNNRAWTNLFLANGTTPVTDAAAVTSLGTAAAIAGQGALATRNEITASGGNAMRFTDNLIPDNEYRDLSWWGAGNLPNFYFVTPDTGWSLQRTIEFNSDRDFDISSQFFNLERGSTYRIRCRIWNNNTAAGWSGAFWPILHIPNQAWFSLRHGTSINPEIADASNAIVANGDTLDQEFYFTLTAAAARQVQFRFKSTARGSNVAMQFHISKVNRLGRDLIRSDTNLPYQTGDIQTNLGVASAISGQSPWATSTLPISKLSVVRSNMFPYPYAPSDGRSPAQVGWQNTTGGGGALVSVTSPYLDGSAYVYSRNTGGAAAIVYPLFDVDLGPNLLTSVGFYGYGNPNSVFSPYIEFLNAARNTVLASHLCVYNSITDRWEVNGVWSPANTAYIRFVMRGEFAATSAYQDIVWWGIKLERGAQATPLQDSSFVRSFGNRVEYNNGLTVNDLRPAEFGSNVTETRVASAISGQTAWATLGVSTNRISQLNDSGRTNSRRALSQIMTSGVIQMLDTNPITATTNGSGVSTVNINAHNVFDDAGQIWFAAASIGGLAHSTLYYIWEFNPDFQGGARSYVATTDRNQVTAFGRRFVGFVTTPAPAAPPAGGGGGGGGGWPGGGGGGGGTEIP